ncbi:hypothetical protein [Streptomyces sp. NBC_01750]|uniref:hypothetical protein n=1 Tax=Streptomyces sp. NBC_01750 TaxID=2975928 RepID=UPI002DD82B34|nr:hypothetical protein [Streptomyces sp. NBC_01750]WSD32286.1 hypothetical protein OG966_10420 [Streptomyces sp. NBC_01750]
MTTSPDAPGISVAPDAADASEPGRYVARLPIGEPLPLGDHSLTTWETFPFTGELRVKALTAPVLPEPPRSGEGGPGECRACACGVEESLWADDHWRLDPVGDQDRLPAVVMLRPRGHHDFTDLPTERAAELGPLLQRAERAVLSLGGIARVHINRWGDGSAHLHFWLIARPAGMTQLRGSLLPLWEEVLPPVPDAERRAAHIRIAASLAAGGGTAYAR